VHTLFFLTRGKRVKRRWLFRLAADEEKEQVADLVVKGDGGGGSSGEGDGGGGSGGEGDGGGRSGGGKGDGGGAGCKDGDQKVRRTRNSKGLDTKNQQLDQQCNRKFNKY
jgi:hypothetical protein